jgi:hypothetical protein
MVRSLRAGVLSVLAGTAAAGCASAGAQPSGAPSEVVRSREQRLRTGIVSHAELAERWLHHEKLPVTPQPNYSGPMRPENRDHGANGPVYTPP